MSQWLEIDILSVKNDIPYRLGYSGRTYKLEPVARPSYSKSHLYSWLKTKELGYIFSLKDFSRAYPKHRYTTTTDLQYISGLIKDKKLLQLSNKTFKLVKLLE